MIKSIVDVQLVEDQAVAVCGYIAAPLHVGGDDVLVL